MEWKGEKRESVSKWMLLKIGYICVNEVDGVEGTTVYTCSLLLHMIITEMQGTYIAFCVLSCVRHCNELRFELL